MGTELVVPDPAAFDYKDLAKRDVTALEKHAASVANVQDQVRRISAEGVILIGKELKAAQERLAGKGRDGMFRPWVKHECRISHNAAYQAIRAFDAFKKCNNLLHFFDASALYLLSADSCPEEATEEAIRLAESGEKVTHKKALALKKQFGEPREDGKPEEEEDDPITEWDLEAYVSSVRKLVFKWHRLAPDADKELVRTILTDLVNDLKKEMDE